MAEAIVGPLLSKLQQVAVTEGKALAGVGNEINRLRDKLMWLHALVHETDLRSRNDGNQLVRVLACQMREVAFEAEDAVDSFFLEADLGHDWCRAVAKFFLNFGMQIRVRCILSGKIKSMNARLEDIIDNSTNYNTNSASAAAIMWRASRAIPPVRQNWYEIDLEENKKEQAKLVTAKKNQKKGKGKRKKKQTTLEEDQSLDAKADESQQGRQKRKEKKEELNNVILDTNGSHVICVVGESGIGKRYLVKKVYENIKDTLQKEKENIEDKFDVYVWQSFPPDTANITDQKLFEKNITYPIKTKLEEECSKLPRSGKNLDQVKFLVVVDCPMSSTTLGCSFLQESLKGRKGSKIVLTATSRPRDDKNVHIIELGYLLKDESKVLFNRILGLKGRRPTNYKKSMMDKVREPIEDLTKGLPLAVVLLAKLMRTMDYSKWETASNYIRNNHQDDQLNTIVSMCIDDLPDELKSCLLYTAGFSMGSIMEAGQLVRLWMAEGFLAQHRVHGVEPEELGQRYLKEFIFRGLVVVKNKGDTLESVALLHERVHEFFRSEAQRTSFMEPHYGGSALPPDSARRLALSSKILPDKNMVLTKLRTVLSHGHDQWQTQHSGEQGQSPRVSCPPTSWCGAVEFCHRPSPQQTSISGSHDGHHVAQGSRPNPKEDFRRLLKHSTFLRVISLEGINIGEKLPNQIGNMLHLQYLGVRCCNMKKVPGSIGKLRKLQTMDVRGTEVKKLPKSFWKINALHQVLGDGLEVPESARHLTMLNETVSVLPSTATCPHLSSLCLLCLGEAQKAESEESMMPPKAASTGLAGGRRSSETFTIHDNAAPTAAPLSADEGVQELGEDVESSQDSDVTGVMGQATKTTNSKPYQQVRRSERIAQQPRLLKDWTG